MKTQSEQEWRPIPAGRSSMTLRERWNRTMHFRKPDRLPLMEFKYWDTTLNTWHRQGLPESVQTTGQAYAYFGIESWASAPVDVYLRPAIEPEVIEEGEDYLIWRDSDGALRKEIRKGARSIPKYLRFAIRDRADWEAFRKRLDPDTPGRYPDNWYEWVGAYADRDFPLSIKFGSMLGWPRNWIGFENIGMMFYDDPELIDEIIETVCRLVCATIKRALKDVRFDFASGWEDICFKNGPIISPKMFAEHVVPRYRRITDLLRAHGIDVIWTDCDGDIRPLADLFLEGGINCMFPLEVAAGSDPVELRERYGHRMLLHGGVDKMALREGGQAIERELLRLKPVVDDGGYVPHLDHLVPEDVTLENYKLYLRLKREIYGAGDLAPHYEEP